MLLFIFSKFPLFCFRRIRLYYWPLFRLNGLFSFFNLHKHNNTFFFIGLTTQSKLCSEFFFTHEVDPMIFVVFYHCKSLIECNQNFHFSMAGTSFILYYPCVVILHYLFLYWTFWKQIYVDFYKIHICLFFSNSFCFL